MSYALKFIKLWNYNFSADNFNSLRTVKSIPPLIRVLLTSNGSFTLNSGIISNDLTEIILLTNVKRGHISDIASNVFSLSPIEDPREVWLIENRSKKKLHLQDLQGI
uniref:Uncharacterized protein n=1 Tax=Yamadaella caenomyce TaxID=259029 RepID=A0A1G4NYL4_9FLOR|nr:Hypothetical protein ORF_7 [Yamadaella caenomyce]SCW23747.1 Hypothetical protein ORF_7 [Yamadaella caenomyce]